MEPQVWMGLKLVQWKVLVMIASLSLLLYYRERKYADGLQPEVRSEKRLSDLHLFFLSVIVLLAAFRIGNWLTADERNIAACIVLPLCSASILHFGFSRLLTQKYLKGSIMLLCAMVMMGQKADVLPESYTAINATAIAGSFQDVHNFHYQYHSAGYDDCFGSYPAGYDVLDRVPYVHSYGGGSIGISHKDIINKWQSILMGVNLFAGQEVESPHAFYSLDNFKAPTFKNNMYGINPMIQYDGRGIGLGIGASYGVLGFDKYASNEDHIDYEPKSKIRRFSFQVRERFFSERYFFLEALHGYDGSTMGQYAFLGLLGSRFNTNKYMLQFGFANGDNWNSALVMRGQFLFLSKYCLYPEVILFRNSGTFERGYRSTLTFQYRFYKKKDNK